jgi:hypothetical protein
VQHIKFEIAEWDSSKKKKPFVPTSVTILDTATKVRDTGMPFPWDEVADAGKWVAMNVIPPFPPKKQVFVTIPPGMPCAEGPLRTPNEISFYFSTLPPFTTIKSVIPSDPHGHLYLIFSQPLTDMPYNPDHTAQFDPSAERDAWATGGEAAARVFAHLRLEPAPEAGVEWAVFKTDTRIVKLLPSAAGT